MLQAANFNKLFTLNLHSQGDPMPSHRLGVRNTRCYIRSLAWPTYSPSEGTRVLTGTRVHCVCSYRYRRRESSRSMSGRNPIQWASPIGRSESISKARRSAGAPRSSGAATANASADGHATEATVPELCFWAGSVKRTGTGMLTPPSGGSRFS